MAHYTLHHAMESESGQIVDLIHLVEINPSGLDWKRFIVAVSDEGKVIGTGQVKPHGKDVREVASIATHPDHRGEGIARSIIELLLKENSRPLYLMCLSENGPLYEKFGFGRIIRRDMPRYFQRMNDLFNVRTAIMRDNDELWVMKLE